MTLEVIIVSFNTAGLLNNCLKSLFDKLKKENLQKNTKVTVVDNASIDNSLSIVKKNFPQVNIIANKTNSGFASANNQAIRKSSAEYILLLNSDTIVLENSLSLLIKEISINKKVIAVGPRLLNKDGSIQQSFGFSPTFFRIFSWMLFIDDLPVFKNIIHPYHAQGSYWYKTKREVDWVSGAVILFKREIIKKIGLLDEKIFMYGEEVEWCYRIRKNKGLIIYFPDAQITHLGGGSQIIPGSNIIKEFESIIYFYQKHNKDFLIIVRYLLKIGALLRLILFGIIGFNPAKITLYAKAYKLA